ncbi:MAG: DUF885 domain-containing protein [Streptosporangiales bacterium]|nr:DUF885 domain-containing protein [Streptosporangiales bacterium]
MSAESSGTGSTEADLAALAAEYVDDLAERHPDEATELGDHRFDRHLPDLSGPSLAAERQSLGSFAERIAALTAASGGRAALSPEFELDAALLAEHVARRIFELEELREHAWNPLLANPGRAVYGLLARDFAPLDERLSAVAGRLSEIPAFLAAARGHLDAMPRVHVETAITQFDGTIALVAGEIDAVLAKAGASAGVRAEIDQVRPAALTALAGHRDWLQERLDSGGEFADPRIGPEKFARKLSLTLSAAAGSDTILARAETDLDQITEEITALAADLGGTPREVLDRLAADASDGDTILRFCSGALEAQTAFVRDRDLVTVYDDPVELIDMPEIDRGVAVAYCDFPGPLETTRLPTFIAVSPTPQGWTPERVTSFYREYNRHMVHNLMAHEAMPGHYLQQAHARRFSGATRLRAATLSGPFIEGWAAYTEELMAGHGYPGEGDPRAVKMQMLKMRLRTTINSILDARVHAHGMTETEAMELMTVRGFQEEGEAAGKWRRALLTSAQLSTYYVGYTEISDLARELLAGPGATPRSVHDRMLAHGSPPVRLLRTVL